MQQRTVDVLVQKDISLATGESVNAFVEKVRNAGIGYLRQKLNVPINKAGSVSTHIYPVEIFSKSIIFDVYKYGDGVKDEDKARFYAVAYARKDDGSFEFSTLTEVERVVGYQPKSTAVAKSKEGGKPFEPIEIAYAELDAAPGWAVAKSFWNGVL
jgi:hypothetical protein